MLKPRGPSQTSASRPSSSSPDAHAAADAEARGDSLQARAQESQADQAALFEASSPLESQYSAALAAQLGAKHDQVERIEDRLEALIAQQTTRLARIQDARPGRFSLPGTKAAWQQQALRQQATVQRLHHRLEEVREIRDGMGLHGPRLEELAARKLRAQQPELAADWDEMREARRAHQAMARKHEQERTRRRGQEPTERPGRSLGLTLTQAR